MASTPASHPYIRGIRNIFTVNSKVFRFQIKKRNGLFRANIKNHSICEMKLPSEEVWASLSVLDC